MNKVESKVSGTGWLCVREIGENWIPIIQLTRDQCYEYGEMYAKIAQPEKGEYGGECARTACKYPRAFFFNNSTRKYYCTGCARSINEFEPNARLFDDFIVQPS